MQPRNSSPEKERGGIGLEESESDHAGEYNGQITDVLTQIEFNGVPRIGRSVP